MFNIISGMITVRFFASLKDIVGEAELQMNLDGETTSEEIFRQLQERYPALAPYRPVVLVAINQEYGSWEKVVKPGDEVAFFPPVSGGLR